MIFNFVKIVIFVIREKFFPLLCCCCRIRDQSSLDPGSEINNPDPQHWSRSSILGQCGSGSGSGILRQCGSGSAILRRCGFESGILRPCRSASGILRQCGSRVLLTKICKVLHLKKSILRTRKSKQKFRIRLRIRPAISFRSGFKSILGL